MSATEIFKGIFVGEAPADRTEAQKEHERLSDIWHGYQTETPDGVVNALEVVEGIADVAFKRAEEVHTEHDRMILDLQGTVRDLAEGKLGPVNPEMVKQIVDVADLTTQRIIDVQSVVTTHRADIEQLRDQIAELQRTVDDLVAGEGVRPAIYPPVVTERFMHKQTAKGWRLDESSLTIDWKGAKPDAAARAEYFRDSFASGNAEADERNRAESA